MNALCGTVIFLLMQTNSISLSMSETIDRALKYNLGVVVSEQETRIARAARLRALSELLPRIYGEVKETVEQINLAAFGFSGFPGQPSIVGPFSVFDARAHFSQPVVELRLRHDLRAASERLTATNLSQQDAREMVVLIVVDLYLDSVSAASRVDAARAQLKSAQAIYDRSVNLKNSGVIAGIDVIRAQVQLQAQQQRVTAAENDLAKKKLTLARAIGLQLRQDFSLSDAMVTASLPIPSFDQALGAALDARPDYRRAQALIRAAEAAKKSAASRPVPSLQVNADYGDIGRAVGSSHGTMTVEAKLLIPIYGGGRTRAEVLETDAILEQRKAEATNLRDRIEYEVRTAYLDIQTADQQVKLADSARQLARQQFEQAQDRFAAGVATSLEVVQGQEALATADENYISSVFSLNVAQASLAKAMGAAEKTMKTFFGGR